MTSLLPPLVVSSATRMNVLEVVESPVSEEPWSEAWEAPGPVTLGAHGTSQGTVSIEVDGVGPQLIDDVGGSLQDLVKCGTDINVPEGAAVGDEAESACS
jgi:hypothetical protein